MLAEGVGNQLPLTNSFPYPHCPRPYRCSVWPGPPAHSAGTSSSAPGVQRRTSEVIDWIIEEKEGDRLGWAPRHSSLTVVICLFKSTMPSASKLEGKLDQLSMKLQGKLSSVALKNKASYNVSCTWVYIGNLQPEPLPDRLLVKRSHQLSQGPGKARAANLESAQQSNLSCIGFYVQVPFIDEPY
eukprot:1146683-Pelagomonas_calceolata.AAC.2